MSPKLLNILLLSLSFVLYFGFLSPYYTGEGGFIWSPEKSVKQLQEENVQYINSVKLIGLVQEAAKTLSKDFSSIPEDVILKSETMLPNSIDPVKLRNEVLYISAQSGVAINGLDVTKDVKGDKELDFYKVSFSMRVRYADLKKFMEKYERSKRFFIIDSLSISKPKIELQDKTKIENLDLSALDVRIVSRVYYMK